MRDPPPPTHTHSVLVGEVERGHDDAEDVAGVVEHHADPPQHRGRRHALLVHVAGRPQRGRLVADGVDGVQVPVAGAAAAGQLLDLALLLERAALDAAALLEGRAGVALEPRARARLDRVAPAAVADGERVTLDRVVPAGGALVEAELLAVEDALVLVEDAQVGVEDELVRQEEEPVAHGAQQHARLAGRDRDAVVHLVEVPAVGHHDLEAHGDGRLELEREAELPARRRAVDDAAEAALHGRRGDLHFVEVQVRPVGVADALSLRALVRELEVCVPEQPKASSRGWGGG